MGVCVLPGRAWTDSDAYLRAWESIVPSGCHQLPLEWSHLIPLDHLLPSPTGGT
jgi:hypothetical protein